jgi:hypothetical protein
MIEQLVFEDGIEAERARRLQGQGRQMGRGDALLEVDFAKAREGVPTTTCAATADGAGKPFPSL